MAATPAVAAEVSEGEQLFFAGQYEECIEMAAREIERGNYLESWRRLRIESQLAIGQYEEALASVTQALEEFPASLPLRLLAHSVYLYNGQSARAATEFDTIERLAIRQPNRYSSPASRLALGRYFLRLGADAREVLEIFYDPIVASSPGYVDAHLASAELSLAKYDNALAAETLTKAPEAARTNPHYHYLLARAYLQDDPEAASAAIEAALQINPRHAKTLLVRVEQLVDAEQYAEARKLLDAILSINPREPLAWAYRAVLAHVASDADAEQAARGQALADWAANPEVDHTIGRKLSDKYRFTEGAAYQRRALELDGAYLPARIQLAQDLLRLGEEDEGWQLASDVFDADGYNVVAHNLVTLHDTVRKYRVLSNDSFRVRMEAREAAIYGDRVLALLDRAKAALCAKYDAPLDRVIAIEIFPEQKDFAVRTFGLPGADGFLGVCFGNVITANSPAALGASQANWESVLWHEFCHVVTLRKSRNKMPRWLSEGISVYEERQENPAWGQSMTPEYRQTILSGKMPPLSKLSGAFLAPETPMALQFAYYESSLVVEFLIEQFGLDAVKQILADLGEGVAIEDALARNAAPVARLDRQFETFARERAEALAPQLSWDEPELEPDAPSDDVAAWLADRPTSFRGLVELGGALQREKKWRESLDAARRLRDAFPDYVGAGNAYWLLARAHRELGNEGAERDALEQWARRSSDATDAYERLLTLAAEAEDWEAVFQNAHRLLAVNPLTPTPHRMLAKAAERLDRTSDAVAAYRALLSFDTSDPVDAHYQLARLLHKQGDAHAARRQVLMALEDAPRFLDAHRLLLELSPGGAAAPGDARPAGEPPDTAGRPAPGAADEPPQPGR
ncbi:MAG TPA: tetratricopeptide repeat protein [Lacipirellulaceae bacterium]|nr:tetratricopeptide repeat protein [Lacipirellulaceae bacterium]